MSNNPFEMLGAFYKLFGIDQAKLDQINEVLKMLKQSEFGNAGNNIDNVMNLLKELANGKLDPIATKKLLETELNSLKEVYAALLKTGKITETETNNIKASIDIERLKAMIADLKIKKS